MIEFLSDPESKALPDLQKILDRLKEIARELKEVRIEAPRPHQSDDLQQLLIAAGQARGFAERASVLQSEAVQMRAVAGVILSRVKDDHQKEYDETVTRDIRLHGDLSWEERASFMRVQHVDALIHLRKVQRAVDLIGGMVESIEVLARGIYRARGDIQLIVDTYKVLSTATGYAQRGEV